MQINDRLRLRFGQMKKWLLEFNLFRSHPQDPPPTEHELQTQLVSTRLFIFLLTISVLTIVISTSQIRVTRSVTVEKPIYDQYVRLSNTYPETLSCPCTAIAITYDKFIHISALYHQVCNSIYITSDWQSLIGSTSKPNKTSLNFGYIGVQLFKVLSSFCNLTQSTIIDSLIDFNATQFISGTVISRDNFDFQTDTLMSLFVLSTTQEFARSRAIIRDEFQLNHLLSGLFTNFEYGIVANWWAWINATGDNVVPISRLYGDQLSKCSCADSPLCTEPVYIDDNRLVAVPGMLVGCYIVEALLLSNIACFYNQPCINDLVRHLNSTIVLNTTALDPTVGSRYAQNSTIGSIVDQLMVEQWTNTTSHKAYYTECHPEKCTYTYVGKRNWLSAIVTVLTPIKGLVIILRMLLPLIVKLFRRCSRPRTNQPGNYSVLLSKLKRRMYNLNVFRSSQMSMIDREYQVKAQIISTYVYLITLVLSLLVLVVYVSQVTVKKSITISSSSYDMYVELYERYEENLSCPCTMINVRHDEFVQIEVRFHQICASDFVSNAYFSFLKQSNFLTTLNSTILLNLHSDVTSIVTGQSHLQLVAFWCQLATSSFDDDRAKFYTSQFTAKDVVAKNLFNQQIHALISSFIATAVNTFIRSLALARQTIQNNAIMSGYKTNSFFYFRNPVDEANNDRLLLVGYNFYYPDSKECICIFSDTCTEPLFYAFTTGEEYQQVLTVPGLLNGCYIDEATLESTLECYFNQSCLDTIHSQFQLLPSFNATVLNSSISSQFSSNSPISNFVSHMMVENWTNSSSHVAFYNKCKPSTCTYSYEGKNDLLITMTIIIGLVGGLTTVLRIIVPVVIIFLTRCHRHVTRQQNPPSGNIL